MKLPNPYLNPNYRTLIVVPVVLVALALVSLFFFFPVKPGVDLRGGLLLQVQTESEVDVALLTQKMNAFSDDVTVRVFDTPLGTKGVEVELASSDDVIEAESALKRVHELQEQLVQSDLALSAFLESGNVSESQVSALQGAVTGLNEALRTEAGGLLVLIGSSKSLPDNWRDVVELVEWEFDASREAYRSNVLKAVGEVVEVRGFSVNEVGSSLSRFFLEKASEVLIWSFVLSSVLVLIVFRSLRPSLAVIFGAVADVVIVAAVMGVLGIPLTLASIAGLLMLIGFSLDTDVMLTVRVLKRTEGRAVNRAFEAMKTGFLMNVTTITAFGVLLVMSWLLQIPTYFHIGAVAVIGGFVDFFPTWAFNAVIVLDEAQKKEKRLYH
ncbi:MAG: hypothetical protein ACE5DI_02520 [Candidatus Micrarchaeia archaeon]